MKIGIVGFSGSGKTTVFQWFTGVKPDPSALQRGQMGIAKIPDARLDWLSAHFKPKKTTPATIEFVDTPGLLATERKDNPRRLAILREAGGLLIVLNGFTGGDPAEELRNFHDELIFADLEIVTNRINRLEDQIKKPRPQRERDADQHEIDVLKKLVAVLEAGQPASTLGLHEDQEKTIRSFQLLTLKPEIVLVNIGEDQIDKPPNEALLKLASKVLQAPVKLELELTELPETDRAEFMKDLGLVGLSREDELRKIYDGMGRIVFFTVGEDECRAWSINAGDTSVTGAAQIHTDLAEGFVRAEIVHYDDFKKLGSMKEAKSRGVFRLEGKTYIVKDGDIMHILANK